MQLKSFAISNFRSIKNVKCFLSPKITILAGKNESGKTTILEALQLLNSESVSKETDKPRNIDNPEPYSLICNFKINNNEKIELLSKYLPTSNIESDEIIIEKKSTERNYILYGEFLDLVLKKILQNEIDDIEIINALNGINEILQKVGHPQRIANINKFESELTTITTKINELNSILLWAQQNNKTIENEIRSTIEQCLNNLIQNQELVKIENAFSDDVVNLIPRIVLFSSFNDLLSPEIPISDFTILSTLKSKHKIIHDLISLAKFDLEGFASANSSDRANMTSRASKVTSDLFGKYWHQAPIEISFRPDGDKILFFIQDKNRETLYLPNQRSKGLQWYISFFLRLTAEGNTNNILLIDEPGLYLHAKAQQDVLGLLEELSENNQIIFSTHSPYLIDPTKLARVRLVQNNLKKGDIELTDFNTEAEQETLTPIITAIGLDITKGLSFPNKQNIIIEGVSDYYYLNGILHYLKKNESYVFPEGLIFVPCVGNTKVGTVASLLEGYNLNYKILLDNKGSTKTKNALINDGIKEQQIISVGHKETDSIEELFDKEDQKQFDILDGKGSKTLISRKFYDKITDNSSTVKLTKKTLDNFKKLFDSVKQQINPESTEDSIRKKIAFEKKDELKERIYEMKKEQK